MIRSKWLVFALLTSLIPGLITGCPQGSKVLLTCELTPPPNPASESAPLTIAMYVDGTPSMQGYVTHPTNDKTRYAETIDLLERTLFIGGTPRSISQEEYYRLGETPEKIASGRQGYLESKQRKFYDGSAYPPLETVKIENAISDAQENKLTVIITDLYQAREDVSNINRKLEEYYLNLNNQKADYAVGILAIKSEFNGKVYVEDETRGEFLYATNDQQGKPIAEFRPFYVIFIGQYNDISYYFDKISKDNKIPADSHLTIFSANHLVKELSYVDGEPKQENNEIKKIAAIGSPRIEINQQKIHLYQINQTSKPEIDLNYKVPLATYNNTSLPFTDDVSQTSNNIETDAKIQVFDQLSKTLKDEPKNSQLEKALEFGRWQRNGQNNLNFITTIKPSIFPKPGFYYFIVDAKAKGIEPEKWWSEWSSTKNISRDWKTFNLEPFLLGLKASTDRLMQENKPVIGRFCYGIEKK
ncbi:MAG: hypothetical protein C6Y22_10600 [Hapalosiphonaceae cyanobacterium JJU2]|nr:MAG: hypothetical protein C6Y22_10600 [Hapalosiphonaceae cyanobacterium JJU2]